MSNTPRIGPGVRATLCLALGGWLAVATPAAARVDETQPQIEDRLLAGNTAKKLGAPLTVLGKYRPQDFGGNGPGQGNGRGRGGGGGGGGLIYVMDGFDFEQVDNLVRQAAGEEPAETDSQGAPQSSEFPMHNYFKSDDGSSAEVDLQKDHHTLTGWELQVYFYKGVSVLEVYRRIHKDLADTEIALILGDNGARQKWSNASVPPATWEQKGDSFLGYDYVREDGKVRALKKGNDLVIFSAGLDQRLVGLMDKAKAVETTSTKGTAPVSVKGF